MEREKKSLHKVQMTEGKRNIIHQLLKEYDIQNALTVMIIVMSIKQNMSTATMEIDIPQDRNSTFQCIKRYDYQTNFRNHRGYLETLEDFISEVTDKILLQIEN